VRRPLRAIELTVGNGQVIPWASLFG
jgi:hypothetical protein